jgi:hypothetical protein
LLDEWSSVSGRKRSGDEFILGLIVDEADGSLFDTEAWVFGENGRRLSVLNDARIDDGRLSIDVSGKFASVGLEARDVYSLDSVVAVWVFGSSVEFGETDGVYRFSTTIEDTVWAGVYPHEFVVFVGRMSTGMEKWGGFEIDEISDLVRDGGWVRGIGSVALLLFGVELRANDSVGALLSGEELVDPVVSRVSKRRLIWRRQRLKG